MSEILLGIAQLAIAIAGFAGLIFYFAGTKSFSATNTIRLKSLLGGALSAAFHSMIALMLIRNFDESTAAISASSFWLVLTGGTFIAGVKETFEASRHAGSLKTLYAVWALLSAVVVILAMNIVQFQSMNTYIIAPIYSILMSTFMFVRIAGELLE
jgi:hypothetical protein